MPPATATKPKPRRNLGARAAAREAALAELASPIEQLLLESSTDRVELIDPHGRVRFINGTGCELMAADRSQFLGKRWVSLWPREERVAVAGVLDAATGGRVVRFSGGCPTSAGAPRSWDVTVSPVTREAGPVLYVLAVWRDVTAKKAAEQALQASEQRFRALANNIAQLAWMADGAGAVFWYNQRWLDYTGHTHEKMVRAGWKERLHPDHVRRVETKLRGKLRRGEAWEDTFPLLGADGEYRWFLWRALPIYDEHGKIVLWCGTGTDINEHLLAKRRLEKLARVIELSHEAVLIWEPEAGILIWNRGCEQLYGYSREEAMGGTSHELLKTRYPMGWERFRKLIVRDGKWSGELLQTAKDGREVWVDSRQEFINVFGRSVVLESNRDISERRMADEIRDLLVSELNHRVKNMLAIVQSIAAQTARNAKSTTEFVNSFIGRLQSLSAAHNILTDAHWSGASIAEVVRSEVAVTVGSLHNVELLGKDVYLPAQTALQLTLLLHELASNAVQHGALSVPTGRVSISWEGKQVPRPMVTLTWKECGGPPVLPPQVAGFGVTLIERSGQLPHLHAELEFKPDGVQCHIVADLQPAATLGAGFFDYFNPRKRASQA